MTNLIITLESQNDPDLLPFIDCKLSPGEHPTFDERGTALVLCTVIRMVLQKIMLTSSDRHYTIQEDSHMFAACEKMKDAGIEISVDRERLLAAIKGAS
jgi:hypothetical protein